MTVNCSGGSPARQVATVIGKFVAGGALLYAAGIVFFCPCTILVKCHIINFYVAILVAVVTILIMNGFHCL